MAEDAKYKQYEKVEDAVADLQSALNALFENKKWMVALWEVDDQNRVNYQGKWTWQFPRGDFLPAVHHLVSDMHKDQQETVEETRPKLQLAPFLMGGQPQAPAPQPAEINEEKEGE